MAKTWLPDISGFQLSLYLVAKSRLPVNPFLLPGIGDGNKNGK